MRRLKKVVLAFLGFYAVIALMLMLFQEKLIFLGTLLPQDFTYQFDTEIPFEELFLEAEDGALLNGLHFKNENPKGVILYFHGNAGNLEKWGEWGSKLAERFGYDVVMWDYRGYGKSSGKRSFQAMLNDGQLFYDYATKHFDETNTVVFGRSLGGAFASHIVKQNDPSKYISESTFTNIKELAKDRYWFLPIDQLLKYGFQSEENIQKINIPTLFIHGTEDDVVPYMHGKRLYELSAADQKQLFTVTGGAHNDLQAYPEFFERLEGFLAE